MATFIYSNDALNAGKYAAWIAASVVAIFGLLFARQHIAEWLLKLYQYFIQKIERNRSIRQRAKGRYEALEKKKEKTQHQWTR